MTILQQAPPPARPIVRYHGGKWMLGRWIIGHFPKHRTYTEAYGGAGSVLLQKPCSYAEIYNDLDGEIVNVFRMLRDAETAATLKRLLELTPFSRDEFELSYKPADDPIEQARRTIFRSCSARWPGHCSGAPTGFRSDPTRPGSTPVRDWRNYPAHIDRYVARLRGVVIENRPALDVLRQYDSSSTLHYVDPPYVHDTRDQNPRRGYRHEMDDGQHRELAAALHNLTGYVVLSGYRCPLYDELFAGWRRVDRETFADGARARTESLWLSPRTASAIPQQMSLFSGV